MLTNRVAIAMVHGGAVISRDLIPPHFEQTIMAHCVVSLVFSVNVAVLSSLLKPHMFSAMIMAL